MNEENKITKVIPDKLNVFGSGFEHAQRMAQALSASAIVPRDYIGNVPNCLIALDVAMRMNVGPLAVMQNMYVVHGKPGFEAKLVAAAVNACGRYSTLRAVCNGKTGDDYGYRAEATEISTGEKLVGTTVDWRMVKAEGWNQDKPLRDGKGVQRSKWNTMPEQMFKYRAMSFWQREFDPGLTMGISTIDEIIDEEPAEIVVRNDRKDPITIDNAASASPTKSVDEELRDELIKKAREKWGDDAMMELSSILRSKHNCSFSDATVDTLLLVLESI
jgi:hypothetical protein